MNQGSVYSGGGAECPPALSLFPRVTTSDVARASGGVPHHPHQGAVQQSIHEALMSRIRPFGLAVISLLLLIGLRVN